MQTQTKPETDPAAEPETQEHAVVSVERVGALLSIMLSEGIVEDTAIGLKACAVLETMGLISGTTDELVDGARYRRLRFTTAGKLARGDTDVQAWQAMGEDDTELARAVDELQGKLNLEPEAQGSDRQPWTRSDVISFMAARHRLRRLRPVNIEISAVDEDETALEDDAELERVVEFATIEFERLLPDRTAVIQALVAGKVPVTFEGKKLALALRSAGIATWSGEDDGWLLLVLTVVGQALLLVAKEGKLPW